MELMRIQIGIKKDSNEENDNENNDFRFEYEMEYEEEINKRRFMCINDNVVIAEIEEREEMPREKEGALPTPRQTERIESL